MGTHNKNCYCYTCNKEFHHLGIAGHRASHRRRKEDCKIAFTNGETYVYRFSKNKILNEDKNGEAE